MDADTWIEQAQPSTTHDGEARLLVVRDNTEDRALVSFTLSPPPSGAVLNRASLLLHLESNADTVLSRRRLGVCQLTHDFNASRASWTKYDKNGNAKWMGGDFGVEIAAATLATGTATGSVTIDLTQALAPLTISSAVPLSLIVLDTTTPARPASAELAFTSREGNASLGPTLLLEYCDR